MRSATYEINPYTTNGGITTILGLSKLFSAPIVQNHPMGPIVLDTSQLSDEEYAVLDELRCEHFVQRS